LFVPRRDACAKAAGELFQEFGSSTMGLKRQVGDVVLRDVAAQAEICLNATFCFATQ
jgi:hypothetical protein